MILFNIIQNINPSRLACELLSRSYCNERQPGHLTFFDVSTSKVGRKPILNQAKNIIDKWQFDWVDLSTATFKKTLKDCFGWQFCCLHTSTSAIHIFSKLVVAIGPRHYQHSCIGDFFRLVERLRWLLARKLHKIQIFSLSKNKGAWVSRHHGHKISS